MVKSESPAPSISGTAQVESYSSSPSQQIKLLITAYRDALASVLHIKDGPAIWRSELSKRIILLEEDEKEIERLWKRYESLVAVNNMRKSPESTLCRESKLNVSLDKVEADALRDYRELMKRERDKFREDVVNKFNGGMNSKALEKEKKDEKIQKRIETAHELSRRAMKLLHKELLKRINAEKEEKEKKVKKVEDKREKKEKEKEAKKEKKVKKVEDKKEKKEKEKEKEEKGKRKDQGKE